MKKIEAFTLIELVIVLLISGIVISGIAGIYLTLNKYISESKKKNEYNTEILMFYIDFKDKFEEAESILYYKGSFTFNFTNDIKLSYIFKDDFIVRKGAVNDTFKINVSDIEYKYQNNNIDLINEINFNIYTDDWTIPAFFYKEFKNINFN